MDALVTTDRLADLLGAPGLRVLDASLFLPEHGRDAAAEHEAAHIPGAAFLDLATLRDTASPHPNMRPDAETFAERLRLLGVGDGDRVVLYDDSPLHSSARAWWLFRSNGVRDIALLDGGLAKWRNEGRSLASGRERSEPRVFTPRFDPSGLRDLDAVRASLASREEQLLDARSAPRFTGEEPDPRPHVAAGHIPGSRNLHYADLFEPDGTWKRGEALRAAFVRAGVDLARPIVTTCNSGVTAAVLLFGLHLLGRDAAMYDGSWSEWGADPDTPKATGAA